MSDVTFDIAHNQMEVHERHAEPWRVTLVDTGEQTATGGRLKRVADYVRNEKTFCFTYGDGLSDINVSAQIKFHEKHGKWVTVTAVLPPGRYGSLELANEDGQVKDFVEKPRGDGGLINGGFFVLSPKCLDLIQGDADGWETLPMERLVTIGQMMAYQHRGFWQAMDTQRDKFHLEELWQSGKAPWKVWS
jgi:glucose-1-phosphate cytidylyltransferase